MWSQFETCLGDEETVNNIFCVNGLFKVGREENIDKNPVIRALAQNDHMVIAIDQSLVLFDENNTKCNYLNFGANIEEIVVSESGNLIICALEDGNVHGVYIHGIPVFNVTIHAEDVVVGKTFAGIQFVNDSYILMCASGAIYSLTNIDEAYMLDAVSALNTNDSLLSDSILSNTKFERISSKRYQQLTKTFIAIGLDPVQIISADDSSILFIADKNIRIPLDDIPAVLKKFLIINSRIIGLTDNGTLIEVCPYTKLISPLYNNDNNEIGDVIILESNDNNTELLILTKSKSSQFYSLKIVSFPSMKCTYELPNIGKSWLVQQPKSSVNMYYICAVREDLGAVQQIEMKIISELQPEQRFKKLIRKGYLQQAEEFAAQFNLSIQPILEEKARLLVLEIGISHFQNDMDAKFQNLLTLVNLIEDKNFLLRLQHIDIPDRKMMECLLEFLLKNLDAADHASEIELVNNRLLRLETLKIIDPYACDAEWQYFVNKPSMIKVCRKILKNDICNGCVIWARHASSIVPFLNKDTVMDFLNTISTASQPFHIILWLRHFVPSVLHNNPESMKSIVDWCINQTHSLQTSDLWPEVGLEFINNIFDIFNDLQFVITDVRRQYEHNLDRLQMLIKIIKDLTTLKVSYNLRIVLEEYTMESIEQTYFNLLQKVQLNHMEKLVNDFIFVNLNERGLSALDVIIKYIEFLVKNRMQLISWQERVVKAISLIHREEDKLKCVLMTLKAAPVPWTDTLKSLLAYGQSNHPLAADILFEHKSEILKLIKVKYDWPVDSVGKSLILIFRIIKTNLPELFEDIKIVTTSFPEISVQAILYSTIEVVKRGEIERAFSFINSLESSLKEKCCKMTIGLLSRVLDNAEVDEIESANILEYLNMLVQHVVGFNESDLRAIRNVLSLRQKFRLDINLECLQNKMNVTGLLKLGMENAIEDLKNENGDCLEIIWKKVHFLASLLEIDPILAVLEISKHMNDIYFSCCMTSFMLNMFCIDKNNIEYVIELGAVLVVQQMNMDSNDCMFEFGDPYIFPLLTRMLSHIQLLEDNQIHYLEIFNFMHLARVGSSFYESNVLENKFDYIKKMGRKALENTLIPNAPFSNHLFAKKAANKRESLSIFENVNTTSNNTNSKIQNDPEAVIKFIIAAIKLIIHVVKVKSSPYDRILKLLPATENLDSSEKLINDFSSALEYVMKIKQHDIAFNIVQIITKYSKVTGGKIILHDTFLSMIYKKIIKFTLSQKEFIFVDVIRVMLIVLCTSKPHAFLDSIRKELKTELQNFNLLSVLEMFYHLNGNADQTKIIKDTRIRLFYTNELCKSDSGITSERNLNFISVMHFMKELRNKFVDVELLQKLSMDFSWDYQDVLVTQIITILEHEELEFDVTNDVFDKEQIIVKSSVNRIMNMCQPYINEITDSDLLSSKLIAYMDKINFYFYELYICLIQILSFIDKLPKDMMLWNDILSFLKHKMVSKRRNQPGQTETDLWLKYKSDNMGILPKIAKYRFPFTPIVKEPLKNILNDEVSIGNCEQWFPLIKLHATLLNDCSPAEITKLQDQFCMVAVKNSIGDYRIPCDDADSDKWHLKPINNAFLQSALQLIENIQDPTKKIFLLYFITNHAPYGADQIESAYECYKFAIENEKELSKYEKAAEIIVKIKRKYRIFKTQHILHLHGLTDEKLFQLVENPRELIFALYNHDLILQVDKPNVNQITAEIANYYSMNFKEIQLTLLQNWLSFSEEAGVDDLEETFYEDLNTSGDHTEACVNETFVMRAYFILSSWKAAQAFEFLISLLYQTKKHNRNIQTQLYIMECFTKLIDDSNETYSQFVNQKDYVVVKCVHSLKALGFNFTIEKFEEMDKMNFLKRIWMSHANNQKGLEVMSYICLGFDIFNPIIWNGILKQMISMSMIKQLSSLIDILSTKPSLLHIDSLPAAWECVIKASFKYANKTRSFEQELHLCKSLVMIQTCPVSSKLNLPHIAEECIRIGRPHMAAILVAFSHTSARVQIIELLQKHKSATLKKDIIDLEEMGVIPIITKFVIRELQL